MIDYDRTSLNQTCVVEEMILVYYDFGGFT